MCGFIAVIDLKGVSGLRSSILERSKLLRHRGPDWSGVYEDEFAMLAHERLAIVDVMHGAQPLHSKSWVLAVNGEIYNHQQLRKEYPNHPYQTASDCEVILAMSEEDPKTLCNSLRGMFSFVLWNSQTKEFLVARDPIGIIPLYQGTDVDGKLWFASEMKSLSGCSQVKQFPPGHYLTNKIENPEPYFKPSWRSFSDVENGNTDASLIRKALEDSVHSHLMSDVPYGVLLSGGLDSSLVAAIASKFVKNRVEDNDLNPAWWPQLHTFSIGLEGSPDLAAAQVVADSIGSIHHSFTYTVQEGLDALSDVIWHTETYDITTIRASTPMMLLARRIKAIGIKMVLSGEGADEIFGGYLYFHMAPNDKEFHDELIRKLDSLHLYDCLRANKSMLAYGVEARVPFLDRDFLNTAMTMAPSVKRPNGKIEKHLLREAGKDLLPDSILWRQKEQFSDGVGYSWIDSLREYAEENVSDKEMLNAGWRFMDNPPTTKEGYLYRTIFEKHFPEESMINTVPGGPTIACSSPAAVLWSKDFAKNSDPSGRAVLSIHNDSIESTDER